jgi:hypothetical protein
LYGIFARKSDSRDRLLLWLVVGVLSARCEVTVSDDRG